MRKQLEESVRQVTPEGEKKKKNRRTNQQIKDDISRGIKRCTNPNCILYGIEQPLENFDTFDKSPDKRQYWCKICTPADQAKRREDAEYFSGVYLIYGRKLDESPFIYTGSAKDLSTRINEHMRALNNNSPDNTSRELLRIFNELKEVLGEDGASKRINIVPVKHLYRYIPNVSDGKNANLRYFAEKSFREKIFATLMNWGVETPELFFLNKDEELNPLLLIKKRRGEKTRATLIGKGTDIDGLNDNQILEMEISKLPFKVVKIDWNALKEKIRANPFAIITLDSEIYMGEGKELVSILKELFKGYMRGQAVEECQ